MPHVLRALHLDQWEQELLLAPCELRLFLLLFFQIFSHIALVLFHLYVQISEYSAKDQGDPSATLWGSSSVQSLLCFVLSELRILSPWHSKNPGLYFSFSSPGCGWKFSPDSEQGNLLGSPCLFICSMIIVPHCLCIMSENFCFIFHLVLSWFKVRR